MHKPITESNQSRLTFVKLTEEQKAEKRKREAADREARKEELELEREMKRHRAEADTLRKDEQRKACAVQAAQRRYVLHPR